jgi:hypothetical protein
MSDVDQDVKNTPGYQVHGADSEKPEEPLPVEPKKPAFAGTRMEDFQKDDETHKSKVDLAGEEADRRYEELEARAEVADGVAKQREYAEVQLVDYLEKLRELGKDVPPEELEAFNLAIDKYQEILGEDGEEVADQESRNLVLNAIKGNSPKERAHRTFALVKSLAKSGEFVVDRDEITAMVPNEFKPEAMRNREKILKMDIVQTREALRKGEISQEEINAVADE